MAEVHARSWQTTYRGLVPDDAIADVVKARTARAFRWRTWLSEPAVGRGAFVATVGGRVVGFVFWGRGDEPGSSSDTAEVNAIYLDPGFVGRGIGTALLDAAVGDMVVNQLFVAVLWVLDTNARARRFYEAAGWRPDGGTKVEERPGGKLHEVRYRRLLAAD